MRIYQQGKKGTWSVEFRDPMTRRKVRRSLRVTNRRAAHRLARDLEGAIACGRFHLGARKPWAEAVAAYLAHGAIYKERVTVDEHQRTLTRRFHPPAAVRYVDQLQTAHVESYVAGRKALGLSPFSVNRELRTIRAFCNWCLARSRRWLVENLARGVPYLSEPRGIAAQCLDDATLEHLLDEVQGTRLEGLVLLALNHELRESELIHLRRQDVELDKKMLWVRHDPATAWKVKGRCERVIFLNEVTWPWLARHLAQQARQFSAYLFLTDAGKPWLRNSLSHVMGRVMRTIGIARGAFHVLRHTWATRQAAAGTPIPVLQVMAGWRDFRSMQKYLHLADEQQQQAAQRVSFAPRPMEGRSAKIVSLFRQYPREEG
ncbi:MAG: tyrosine-type recombinase/integrase [Candidatus Methylomirabilota bacterium]|jgi:site-specific recombinase XerD